MVASWGVGGQVTFLNYFVRFVASMAPMWPYSLNYILALAFLASVPYIIYSIFNGR